MTMDLEQMYAMGLEAGEAELEKIASADDEELLKEAFLKKLRGRLAARDQKIHLKRFKKRGGKIGFKHLSGGKKALGLGAVIAAAAGGAKLSKKKG